MEENEDRKPKKVKIDDIPLSQINDINLSQVELESQDFRNLLNDPNLNAYDPTLLNDIQTALTSSDQVPIIPPPSTPLIITSTDDFSAIQLPTSTVDAQRAIQRIQQPPIQVNVPLYRPASSTDFLAQVPLNTDATLGERKRYLQNMIGYMMTPSLNYLGNQPPTSVPPPSLLPPPPPLLKPNTILLSEFQQQKEKKNFDLKKSKKNLKEKKSKNDDDDFVKPLPKLNPKKPSSTTTTTDSSPPLVLNYSNNTSSKYWNIEYETEVGFADGTSTFDVSKNNLISWNSQVSNPATSFHELGWIAVNKYVKNTTGGKLRKRIFQLRIFISLTRELDIATLSQGIHVGIKTLENFATKRKASTINFNALATKTTFLRWKKTMQITLSTEEAETREMKTHLATGSTPPAEAYDNSTPLRTVITPTTTTTTTTTTSTSDATLSTTAAPRQRDFWDLHTPEDEEEEEAEVEPVISTQDLLGFGMGSSQQNVIPEVKMSVQDLQNVWDTRSNQQQIPSQQIPASQLLNLDMPFSQQQSQFDKQGLLGLDMPFSQQQNTSPLHELTLIQQGSQRLSPIPTSQASQYLENLLNNAITRSKPSTVPSWLKEIDRTRDEDDVQTLPSQTKPGVQVHEDIRNSPIIATQNLDESSVGLTSYQDEIQLVQRELDFSKFRAVLVPSTPLSPPIDIQPPEEEFNTDEDNFNNEIFLKPFTRKR